MVQHAVVVVHGVGDPQPGDALQNFVDAYCALTRSRVIGPMQVEQHEDKERDEAPPGLVPLFPVSRLVAALNVKGALHRARFFEVYWGDLARVKGTFLGLVEGTVDLIFGLRHIVGAAQRELSYLAAGTRLKRFACGVAWSSSAALWLARGPILAINAFIAIVALVLLALVAFPDELLGVSPVRVAALGGALATAAIGLFVFQAAQRYRWSPTTGTWLILTGAVAAEVLAFVGPNLKSFEEFAEVATAALSLAAGLMGWAVLVLMLFSLASSVVLTRCPERIRLSGRRALVVINACTILSSALFVFVVMLAWAIATKQIENAQVGDVTKAMVKGEIQRKPPDEIKKALEPVVDKARKVSGVGERITIGLHLFGLVWLSLSLIAVCYLVLVMRAVWLKQQAATAARKYPRYIVHWSVVGMLVATAILWISSFTLLLFKFFFAERFRQLSVDWPWLAETVTVADSGTATGVVLSGLLVSLLVIGRAHLGTALDIVLDVVAHFKVAEPAEPRWRSTPKAIGNAQGYRYLELVHPEPSEWKAMVSRFRSVVEDALSKTQCKTLTVIAHSQGTMIALEALGVITIKRSGRDSSARRVTRVGNPECKIQLITMGCPLAHIYLHYFPGKYAINPRAKSLVESWLNIYRADDFVGTCVTTADATFPHNRQVDPRGHTDYWLDRDVLEIVKEAMPG